jgi:hypothetical protein
MWSNLKLGSIAIDVMRYDSDDIKVICLGMDSKGQRIRLQLPF